VGCIPSKFLLNASKYYNNVSNNKYSNFGIESSHTTLNLDRVMEEKDKVVKGLTGGIEGLFKKNKVD